MKRLLVRIAIPLSLFITGVVVGTSWQARRNNASTLAIDTTQPAKEAWPLTKEVVSRSLQTRYVKTKNPRRNSPDDVVWRWLKKSIAEYPQNWVRLDIVEGETYHVVIYPPEAFDAATLAYYNRELKDKALPALLEGKRYLRVGVQVGNTICPDWSGLIDPEKAKLVYFVGVSG